MQPEGYYISVDINVLNIFGSFFFYQIPKQKH